VLKIGLLKNWLCRILDLAAAFSPDKGRISKRNHELQVKMAVPLIEREEVILAQGKKAYVNPFQQKLPINSVLAEKGCLDQRGLSCPPP
ncbi:hypothetical protein JRQ81_006988, partial [Phrynocephalus forsythii]